MLTLGLALLQLAFTRYEIPVSVPPPFYLAICSQGDSIAFWSETNAGQHTGTFYALNLETHRLRKLWDGRFGYLYPANTPHLFAADTPTELVVFDDLGKIRFRRPHNEGISVFPQWHPRAEILAYQDDERSF